MKITPQKYAQGLYESISHIQDKDKIGKILKRFVDIVIENGDLSKTDLILENFTKIYNLKLGILEANVTSRFNLNDETIANVKKYIMQKSGFENIKINTNIDKNILGGVIIKYNDKVLNISLKNKLRQLKQQMIQ